MSGGDASGTGVDFRRSSCRWRLRGEDSVGQFALDAALWVGERDAECFVLTAQVFAGNVYAGENLFKDPPYGYAAAFSATRYRIFRDAVREPCRDSEGPHGELFRDVTIDLQRRTVRAVRPEALPDTRVAALGARLEIPASPGRPRLVLEFPVRHLNVGEGGRKFQIETGPVLTLQEGEGDTAARLCRAYVNFGRLERAEFLLDAPRSPDPRQRWAHVSARECEISLMQVVS